MQVDWLAFIFTTSQNLPLSSKSLETLLNSYMKTLSDPK